MRASETIQEKKQDELIHGQEAYSFSGPGFTDNRPEANGQQQLQEGATQSVQMKRYSELQEAANSSPQVQKTGQLKSLMNDSLPVPTVQRREEEEKSHALKTEPGAQENNTGLPDKLKSGVEHLSGMSLGDVKVHRNSDKPAQLQAHAYAQGTDIHLGPGQEKHLPHEAWHVVQQKQGRVKPTLQLKGKVNINDNAELEQEADQMGEKALQLKSKEGTSNDKQSTYTDHSVVQKVSVDPPGTTKDQATAKVWLDDGVTHDAGDLYTMDIGHKTTKAELSQAIAKEAGSIGSQQSTQKSLWAQIGSDYGGAKLDAFRVRFSGTFGGANTPLSMDFHFGPRSNGYVVNVSEGANQADMSDNNPQNIQNGVATEYSSIHKQTNNENVLNNTNHAHGAGTSRADSEKAWDSHTKIAGEGARFKSVRKHASNLTDNSKFFTRAGNALKWILFKELWLTWSATFNQRFNITSYDVGVALDANGMQKLAAVTNNPTPATTSTGVPGDITVNTDFNLYEDRSADLSDTLGWKNIKFTYIPTGAGKVKRLQNEKIKTTLVDSGLVLATAIANETVDWRTYTVRVNDNITPDQINTVLDKYNTEKDSIRVEGVNSPEMEEELEDEGYESESENEELIIEEEPKEKSQDLGAIRNMTKQNKKLLGEKHVSYAEIEDFIKKGKSNFTYDKTTQRVTYTQPFNQTIEEAIRAIATIKKKNAPKKTIQEATTKADAKKPLISPMGGMVLAALIAFLIYIIINFRSE